MPESETKKLDARREATGQLFWSMGAALSAWQRVEEHHYLFFFKLLSGPSEEICSVLYFSPPSFESRRVLVDRVAHHALKNEEHKKRWKKLNSRLAAESNKRGRIAHYALDFEWVGPQGTTTAPDGTIQIHIPELGAPFLRSSEYNFVGALKEKAASSNHKITAAQLQGYSKEFSELADDLKSLIQDIPFSKPLYTAVLRSTLGIGLDSPAVSILRYLCTGRLDEPPSD